jgi:hypothetical protein
MFGERHLCEHGKRTTAIRTCASTIRAPRRQRHSQPARRQACKGRALKLAVDLVLQGRYAVRSISSNSPRGVAVAKLRAQGIPVTVANFVSWSSLANEAAAEYRKGRVRNIILVGHSSGATALPDMVARLGHLGVPVKLAIGLDTVFRTKLAGHAERYINFYVASGAGEPVTPTKDFHGALENIDVQSVPGVGHLSIDKSQIMQQRVISAIDAVVFSRRKEVVARHRQLPEPSASEQTANRPEAAASARD